MKATPAPAMTAAARAKEAARAAVPASSCACCARPADDHTLDDARRCADDLEWRDSMMYCRLTGPKR